jgi:hypothetical protein
MSKRINLKGKTFGSLTVLDPAQSINKKSHWYCRCICGRNVTMSTTKLRNYNKEIGLDCGCTKTKDRQPKSTFRK